MIKKFNDESETWLLEFDSVDDFYQNSILTEDGNRVKWQEFDTFQDGAEWVGANSGEIISRKYGWEEGSERAKNLVDLSFPPRTDKFQKVWTDDDGDDGDYERFLNELPCLYKRKKKFASSSIKSGIMKVRVAIGERYNVRAEHMLMKCAAASRIVDELETMGVRCEVWAETNQRNAVEYRYRLKSKTCIKRAEEPLNLSLVSNCLSSWFFRNSFFKVASANVKSSSGMGASEKIEKEDDDEIIINYGECLTEHSANEFIIKLGERIKNGFKSE